MMGVESVLIDSTLSLLILSLLVVALVVMLDAARLPEWHSILVLACLPSDVDMPIVFLV